MKMRKMLLVPAAAAVALFGIPFVSAATASVATASPAVAPWVDTWEAAQLSPHGHPAAEAGFANETLRQVVHISAGSTNGTRIRLSNLYGTGPVTITSAYEGLQGDKATLVSGSQHRLTFGGNSSITIKPGTRAVSDPFPNVLAKSNVVVSLYFAAPTGPATTHPAALTTNYIANGDHAADQDGAAFGKTTTSWFFLDGIAVRNSNISGSVVAFGPSTTDGVGSTAGANHRYPDYLVQRTLALPAGQRLSILNAGQSGNQLLKDTDLNGPSGLHRFPWDALGNSGVKAIIVWEGTNDLSNGATANQLIAADKTLIASAHQHHIRIIGATLQPTNSSGQREAYRNAVNKWIRTSHAFDAVADYDKVLRDPKDVHRIRKEYDPDGGIHPNDAGYRAIANAVNLSSLTR